MTYYTSEDGKIFTKKSLNIIQIYRLKIIKYVPIWTKTIKIYAIKNVYHIKKIKLINIDFSKSMQQVVSVNFE